jgi:uncharacterized MAPEG superfamily protein
MFAIAAALSFLSGWGVIHLNHYLAYAGFVGFVGMAIVTGVHADSVVGGIVFIIANILTYYYLMRLGIHIWLSLRTKRLH